MNTTECPKCGHPIRIGEHPFCPHGAGVSAITQDGIPGGIICENYGSHPIRFDSHSERRRYMQAYGLQEKETWCPMPGTDCDPHGIPNPKGYMDSKTLDNARVLLSRSGAAKDPEFDAKDAGVIRGEFSGHLTERDAVSIAEGDMKRQSRLGRRINGSHAG